MPCSPAAPPEPQALELIRVLQKAGADVNVVALINHREEIRGGTALHYAVRKRYKDVIKLLASFGIDMNAVDQDGLTALDYTQSRGFMPFMALQTPLYKEEAQLLRELGATKLMAKSPVWPVLGPPQGVWDDIWPLGESRFMSRSTSPRSPVHRSSRSVRFSRTAVARAGAFCNSARPRSAGALSAVSSSRRPLARITTTDLGGATLLQGAGCNVIALPGPDGASDDRRRPAPRMPMRCSRRSRPRPAASRIHTLINTHWHPEQTGANEAVGRAGGVIFAHEKTKTYAEQHRLLRRSVHRPRAAAARKRRDRRRPTRGDGSMEFAGQQIDYGYMPAAHTDGDLYVHFPKLNLLVAGGVVSAEEWPLLDYRTAPGWAAASARSSGSRRLVKPDTRVVPADWPHDDRQRTSCATATCIRSCSRR